ncbi:hypothetical protein GW17_00059431 [Ensete ventricosum]|nr:hypothetical protein GW17_00059431 [Ensete ventricosum]
MEGRASRPPWEGNILPTTKGYHQRSRGRRSLHRQQRAGFIDDDKFDNAAARKRRSMTGALVTMGVEGDHGTRSNDGHEKATFETLDFVSTLRDGSEEKPVNEEQGKGGRIPGSSQ